MNAKGLVWWKIIIGAVLIYIESKELLSPGTRALQPDNPTQATSMLIVEWALLLLGVWLAFFGIKGKRNSN